VWSGHQSASQYEYAFGITAVGKCKTPRKIGGDHTRLDSKERQHKNEENRRDPDNGLQHPSTKQ